MFRSSKFAALAFASLILVGAGCTKPTKGTDESNGAYFNTIPPGSLPERSMFLSSARKAFKIIRLDVNGTFPTA